MKKLALILAAIGLIFGLSACSTVSTAPDQVALHYNGGSFSSNTFKDCVPASDRQFNGPGDNYYYYPTSQRIWDASSDKGADGPAFTVVSKAENGQVGAELSIPVSVSFTLKTDCPTLREFHEKYGNRYHAYWEDSNTDHIPAGWESLLNVIIAKPLDTTLDRIAQNYTWEQLYNDAALKIQIEKQINDLLPDLVARQTGGVQYFQGFTALIQKPVPTDANLRKSISDQQSSVAQSVAAKAKAEADKAAAEAQVAVAQAEAKKKEAEIAGYGGFDNYNKAQAVDKGLNPYQPTYIVSSTK